MSVLYTCTRCRYRSAASKLLLNRLYQVQNSSVPVPSTRSHNTAANSTSPSRVDQNGIDVINLLPRRDATSHQPKRRPNGSDEFLESLFAQMPRVTRNKYGKTRYSKTELVSPYRTGPHTRDELQGVLKEEVRRFEKQLHRGRPYLGTTWYDPVVAAEDSWKAFQHLRASPSFQDSQLDEVLCKSVFRRTTAFKDLLFSIIRARAHKENTNLPSTGEVVRIYMEHYIMREWWSSVLWELLAPIVKSMLLPNDEILKSVKPDPRACADLLQDCIEIWKLYLSNYGPESQLRSKGVTSEGKLRSFNREALDSWPNVPKFMKSTSRTDTSADLEARLIKLLPHKSDRSELQDTAAAFATIFLSLQHKDMDAAYRAKNLVGAPEFSRFAAQIIKGSNLDYRIVEARLKDKKLPLAVMDALPIWWAGLWINVRQITQSMRDSTSVVQDFPNEETKEPSPGHYEHGFTDTSADLLRAVRSKDLKHVNKLWHRLREQLEKNPQTGDQYVGKFADFMTAYTSLRHTVLATEVWNTMVRSGCRPTMQHWHAMLSGCKSLQDLPSLERIWRSMKLSGIELNNQLWTTYISALLQCKEWRLALQALNELGKEWKSAAVKDVPSQLGDESTAAKSLENKASLPSIAPVNAAIDGLVRLEKGDLSPIVLRWANKQGISPDTTTFNSLLKHAVKFEASEQVQRVLSDMETSSCQPDIITFTILIAGVVQNAEETAEEQGAAILRILYDMTNSGLKPNAHTYGTLFNSLLESGALNTTNIRVILDYMGANDIKPTAHVYTILIRYYFSQDPPSLDAIDTLWNRMQYEGTQTDHIFYDNMIEGYSKVGDLDKMLAFLRRMPSDGHSPRWSTLVAAIRALARAEEWSPIQDLVKDAVGGGEGIVRHGQTGGSRSEQEFWDYVRTLKRKGVIHV
ncbi:hypothetical protein MMC09_001035 [Bachmanniomyces sp. S44760]|nr:hypothetical protein [Bachmanniomyces sp. S44760]